MPALWTRMSSPSAQRSAIDRGRVVGRDVQLDVRAGAGHVERDHAGAVARERLGDRRADAARGAGDERGAAGQRALPVDRRVAVARRDVDDLGRHVGRAGREQEAQRGGDLVLGAGRDVDELHGRAPADLLGQRAREALQRALRRGRVDRSGLRRRRAEHDDATRRPHAAHRGIEEVLQLDQVGGALDPGGVEHECLEALVGRRLRVEHGGVEPGRGGEPAHRVVQRRGAVGVGVTQHLGGGLGHAPGAAQQHAALDQRVARARGGRARRAAGARCAWPGRPRPAG